MQIVCGLLQLAFGQGQIQERPAGLIGLGTIAPALDDIFGQGLQAFHGRRPRRIGSATEQGLAGRQADQRRLACRRRIAGGPGQLLAQGGRFLQLARSVVEIGQVIAHRVIFFLPNRGRAQLQRQLAILQCLAARGFDLLPALALRVVIVARAAARGRLLLGPGGAETLQGRRGMQAGLGKGPRFARRGRA